MAAQQFERGGVINYMIDLPVRGLFALFALLPHGASLSFAAWFTSRVLAPPFGVNRRIRENLKRVWPQMPEPEIKRLCREVSENSARLMVESLNPKEFLHHAVNASFGGAGKDGLIAALTSERPIILVSGHFGNYQVLRVLLGQLGRASASVYRPMNNAYTNARYIDNMNRIAGPNYPRGMRGTKNLLGHLRKGGTIALLNDQAAYEGEDLTFMGHPARTMTSTAELALKYTALVFPFYCIRKKNGVDFDVVVEAPIAHSDPITMTQDLNDSLDAMVRKHPGQWFWVHRRWKQY